MQKDAIAHLFKDGRRYEMAFPEYALTIRGPYVEWVLEAAADIIQNFERTKSESTVDELKMLQEFGTSRSASSTWTAPPASRARVSRRSPSAS